MRRMLPACIPFLSASVLASALTLAAVDAGGQSASAPSHAQAWVAAIGSRYSVTSDLPYLPADTKAVLDVYAPRAANTSSPVPTAIYFHGGAWMGGDKSVALLRALPYLRQTAFWTAALDDLPREEASGGNRFCVVDTSGRG